jgi:hypothetical protein
MRSECHRYAFAFIERPRKVRRGLAFVVRMRDDQQDIRFVPLVRYGQGLRLLRAAMERSQEHGKHKRCKCLQELVSKIFGK